MATVRDRIVDFRRVPARSLIPHPANWRRHPEFQRTSLAALLAELGYAGAIIVRPLPDGHLQILDGHLRAEITPDQDVPVLVLDLDEDEARLFLATFDPVAMLADRDSKLLNALVEKVETESEEVRAFLDRLSGADANNPAAEWEGMPEFEHTDATAFRSVVLHFVDEDAVRLFERLVGRELPPKARYLWFPEMRIDRLADKQYVATDQTVDPADDPE